MKNLTLTTALVSTLFSASAIAAEAVNPGTEQVAQASGSAATTEMATGEIKRISKSNGKLTIKHGEIKNLDMPPMTMVFQVEDKAMLETVKKGDKIRFSVVERDGAMVVTEIQPEK